VPTQTSEDVEITNIYIIINDWATVFPRFWEAVSHFNTL